MKNMKFAHGFDKMWRYDQNCSSFFNLSLECSFQCMNPLELGATLAAVPTIAQSPLKLLELLLPLMKTTQQDSGTS